MINLYKYLNEKHVALQVHAKIALKKQTKQKKTVSEWQTRFTLSTT